MRYNASFSGGYVILLAAFDWLDHVDALITLGLSAIAVIVGWLDLKMRVKDHEKRVSKLESSDEKRGDAISELKSTINNMRLEIKGAIVDLAADVKVIRQTTARKEEANEK